MITIKPHQILEDRALPALREEYYALYSDNARDNFLSFKTRLENASEAVFSVVNANGLTLLDCAEGIFHRGDKSGRLAIYMDLLIQKRPDLSNRDDALVSYFGLQNGHHGDCARSPETKVYLKRLIDTYDLPDDDETLLVEMKSNRKQIAHHLYYAMLREFPKSVAYGIAHNPIDTLFDILGISLFTAFNPQIMSAIDAFAMKNAPLHERKTLDELLGEKMRQITSYDFWTDAAERIIEPMLTLMRMESGVPMDDAALQYNFGGKEPRALLPEMLARRWLSEGLTPSQICDRALQLSNTWHHSAIRFDVAGMDGPIKVEEMAEFPVQEWHPLSPQPYTTRDGQYTLRSCRTESDLMRGHKILDICVDRYATRCMDGSTHLMSIESADGVLLSIAELQFFSQGDNACLKHPFIPIDGRNLAVTQHEGQKIRGSAQYITQGPLHDALREWLTAVAEGTCPINTRQAGETTNYRDQVSKYYGNSRTTYLIKKYGYYPTWPNINRAFQEFKKDRRGGSIGVDDNNRIVYPEGRPHLISGKVEAGGKSYELRDMSALEWLRATGLAGIIAEQLKRSSYKNLAKRLRHEQRQPLSATCPAPLNRVQFSYALAAGTLSARDLYRLTPQERSGYDKRLLLDRDKARSSYFALTQR